MCCPEAAAAPAGLARPGETDQSGRRCIASNKRRASRKPIAASPLVWRCISSANAPKAAASIAQGEQPLLLAEPMAGTRGAEPVGEAYFGFYLLAMGRGRPRTMAENLAMLRAAGAGDMEVIVPLYLTAATTPAMIEGGGLRAANALTLAQSVVSPQYCGGVSAAATAAKMSWAERR
jgi:hypothetical protein